MFSKKTVYHSELAKAGPIRVKIGKMFKSQYPNKQTGEDAFMIPFEHDTQEHLYLAESRAIAMFLNKFNGQEVTIEAIGAREDARVEVKNVDGTVAEANGDDPAPEEPSKPYKRPYTGPRAAPGKEDYWANKAKLDAESKPRIERQHSQEMALRYLALQVEKTAGMADISWETLEKTITWFQKDISNQPA